MISGAAMPSDLNAPPAIELKAIEKSFGPVHANNAVSMTIARGSITGIIGEALRAMVRAVAGTAFRRRGPVPTNGFGAEARVLGVRLEFLSAQAGEMRYSCDNTRPGRRCPASVDAA